jgi:acetyl esterase/lipase
MKRVFHLFSMVLFAAASPLPAFASESKALIEQRPIPPEAKSYVGYLYKKTSDGTELFLDVFSPPGLDRSRPVSAILFFHGGGWDHGDKSSIEPACRYFTRRGLVTVSANYRFMDTKVPACFAATNFASTKEICVRDARSAIRWVRIHAADLGIDPDRLILAGDSAGTQLALIGSLATDMDDPGEDTQVSTRAAAYVLLNPAFHRDSRENPRLEPFAYVSASMPPMILFSGDKDGFKVNADQLVAACKLANVTAQMWVAPGQLHAFTGQPRWLEATCVKADAFLTHLGLLAGPTPTLPADAPLLVPGQNIPVPAQASH